MPRRAARQTFSASHLSPRYCTRVVLWAVLLNRREKGRCAELARDGAMDNKAVSLFESMAHGSAFARTVGSAVVVLCTVASTGCSALCFAVIDGDQMVRIIAQRRRLANPIASTPQNTTKRASAPAGAAALDATSEVVDERLLRPYDMLDSRRFSLWARWRPYTLAALDPLLFGKRKACSCEEVGS